MQIRSARFFVYATDLPRSLQFYTQVLGLPVVDRVMGGTVLAVGKIELELLQDRRGAEAVLDPYTGFTLTVDDADAAYNQLLSYEIAVLSEPNTAPDGSRVFYIADPDGLPIGIVSEPPALPPADWLYEDQ